MLGDILEGVPGEKLAGVRDEDDNPVYKELSGGENCMYYCFNIFCLIMPLCNLIACCQGCLVIEPMTAIIVLVFDKVLTTKMTPGLNWIFPCCTEKQWISLKMESHTVTNEQGNAFQVPDSTGSPMNVNTMVNYVITDPVKAQYNVEHLLQFINNQAFDVVRRICGRFPYKCADPNEASLLNHSHIICRHMRNMLEKRCKVAGVEILRMDFIEISYDSSMAQQLLQTNKA